jgi:hypothetical protein
VRSQTVVELKEWKKAMEESKSVVLSDEQAKTIWTTWLNKVCDYSVYDSRTPTIDIEIDDDVNMEYMME